MTGGSYIPQAGPDWEGWNFFKGRLYPPSGHGGFLPGHLGAYTYILALNSSLERENKALKSKLQELNKQPIFTARQMALGHLDMIWKMLGEVVNDYSASDDPLLIQIGEDAVDVLESATQLKIDLITNDHVSATA